MRAAFHGVRFAVRDRQASVIQAGRELHMNQTQSYGVPGSLRWLGCGVGVSESSLPCSQAKRKNATKP